MPTFVRGYEHKFFMAENTNIRFLPLLKALQSALHRAPEQSLTEFWKGVSAVPPNEARLLSPALLQQQLYGQIARPWERLKRNKPKKSVLKKMMATDWADFDILNLHPTLSRKPMTLSFVLEFLRNAISHDKVRWDKDLNATFSDWDNNKLRFSLPELIRFMEAFETFRQS